MIVSRYFLDNFKYELAAHNCLVKLLQASSFKWKIIELVQWASGCNKGLHICLLVASIKVFKHLNGTIPLHYIRLVVLAPSLCLKKCLCFPSVSWMLGSFQYSVLPFQGHHMNTNRSSMERERPCYRHLQAIFCYILTNLRKLYRAKTVILICSLNTSIALISS